MRTKTEPETNGDLVDGHYNIQDQTTDRLNWYFNKSNKNTFISSGNSQRMFYWMSLDFEIAWATISFFCAWGWWLIADDVSWLKLIEIQIECELLLFTYQWLWPVFLVELVCDEIWRVKLKRSASTIASGDGQEWIKKESRSRARRRRRRSLRIDSNKSNASTRKQKTKHSSIPLGIDQF